MYPAPCPALNPPRLLRDRDLQQRRRPAAAEPTAPIAGEIVSPGKIEGGDLVWIDRHTLLAGIGYRTNLEGVKQLGKLAGTDVEILWFDMPHYKGTSDVFHLMSCLSPLDRDLAVVYPPLMAARLVEFLQARGIGFVEVPEAGKSLKTGDAFAVVESVKAASDVYAPIAGSVIEGNPALASAPELINSEPYAGGWIARMKAAIRTLGWRFSADRMVRDYVLKCYLPAAGGLSSKMGI
jgi:hypothetical protein